MKKLIEKISKIQETLKVPKSQYNEFGKYRYRKAEDILEALKPLLNGLSQQISDEVTLVGDRYYIKATVAVTDGENIIEVHGWAREALSKKGMDESQITGAASSYARKYALNGMWGIDDSVDSDSLSPEKTSETKEAERIAFQQRVIKGISNATTMDRLKLIEPHHLDEVTEVLWKVKERELISKV